MVETLHNAACVYIDESDNVRYKWNFDLQRSKSLRYGSSAHYEVVSSHSTTLRADRLKSVWSTDLAAMDTASRGVNTRPIYIITNLSVSFKRYLEMTLIPEVLKTTIARKEEGLKFS